MGGRQVRVGSVCSGIEAATVAWAPLGWEFAWYAEVEPFCCALLEHYYPETPNLGDITKITEGTLKEHEPIDLLVGGTPCQSFSVAGLRKGLDDPRGNLALRFLQIVGAARPEWLVWENVPGVLSSSEGRDFGAFLGALAKLGYGFAYRILDAQYFGLAQRRKRVFVVGHSGGLWQRAAAVLLNRESMCRHPPPSREAGTRVAGAVTRRIDRGGVNSDGHDEHVVARPIAHGSTTNHYDESQQTYVVGPLQSHSKEHGHAMTTQQAVEAGQVLPILEANARQEHRGSSRDGAGVGEAGDPMFALQAKHQHAIVLAQNGSDIQVGDVPGAVTAGQAKQTSGDLVAYRTSGNCGVMEQGDKTAALNCNSDPTQQILRAGMTVRRLTPEECESLQGFPRGYTKIPYRNKPAEKCLDGPRYRSLGNSMAVPVIRWIGERIKQVNEVV